MPGRHGEPPVQGGQFKTGSAKQAVGFRLYLCAHMVRNGLRCPRVDVFARRIAGWRISTSLKTQFVLDAPEQAIRQRKTQDNNAFVHHSDRRSQYLSIKSTERLTEARIDLSAGTVGDA